MSRCLKAEWVPATEAGRAMPLLVSYAVPPRHFSWANLFIKSLDDSGGRDGVLGRLGVGLMVNSHAKFVKERFLSNFGGAQQLDKQLGKRVMLIFFQHHHWHPHAVSILAQVSRECFSSLVISTLCSLALARSCHNMPQNPLPHRR